MLRWTSLVLGAATFLAAHAVERALWRSWFSTEWEPFFMNSGRAVALHRGVRPGRRAPCRASWPGIVATH